MTNIPGGSLMANVEKEKQQTERGEREIRILLFLPKQLQREIVHSVDE